MEGVDGEAKAPLRAKRREGIHLPRGELLTEGQQFFEQFLEDKAPAKGEGLLYSTFNTRQTILTTTQ